MKNFDKWNKIKKQVDTFKSTRELFPKEGSVWMCAVGVNVGFEENGSGKAFARPVLIIKKFNNKMYWVVPLSTKQKNYDFYYNFTDPKDKKVSVILAQLRLISIKRFIRDMYQMNQKDFNNITDTLIVFITKSKPRTGRGSSKPKGTL